MAATTKTATIGDLLEDGSVHVGVAASSKSDLLYKLINSFNGREGVGDLQVLTDAVLERESMLSTGVGDGIALPHAKTSAASKTLAAFATTSEPVEFDSFDNRPVQLVFMLIGPPSESREHIRILGRISRLLQRAQVREKLIKARDRSDVIDILQSAEDNIISP